MLSYLLQFLFDFRRPNNKRASHCILHSFYTWIHVFYCHKPLFCPLRTVTSTCIFSTGRHCSHKIGQASDLSAPISRLPAAPRNIPRVDNMINNWCKQKRSGHNDTWLLLWNRWQYCVVRSQCAFQLCTIYINHFVFDISWRLKHIKKKNKFRPLKCDINIRYTDLRPQICAPSSIYVTTTSIKLWILHQKVKRCLAVEVRNHCSCSRLRRDWLHRC